MSVTVRMPDKKVITAEIEAIIRKIDTNMLKFQNKFPHKSATGNYSDSLNLDGNWTGSFWTGMVLLAYVYTEDKKYLDYLFNYMPVFRQRLETGYKDHDLGFLYQLYATALYKITGNEEAKELAVQAGEELLKRYNSLGKFIRAWGRLEEEDRKGKLIMDCMMNLPLLYCASEMSGQIKYFLAAEGHADTTCHYCIREDNSTYHTYDFNPYTGEPVGGFNEGGYADESAWSRGQAWGIYGFVLSYEHTGLDKYLTAAENLADYYLNNLPQDVIPYWDFKLPDFTDALKDASAASIAASGMLDIAALEPDAEKSQFYEASAYKILESLRTNYSKAMDWTVEGILPNCFVRDSTLGEMHSYTIWGDYYYLELLMKAVGINPKLWTLK
ncbi:glycoside hydrolase family 88 protein [Paenibacillus qinlingensis]|uniref:Unsaturated chondroitin disaccharide hydrolase n=1 Tax=Paenibacillus qinlingensis TaxID=1837343 RepID=A0ABU1NXL5_9BACL|nr:glycoside hydrolase family 88 protein [Paenibacillus qinlingensis]MDR6552249.1 unsaturated chondroitin disaccharide hydrolase [Paenibacillus qinlingensis]